MAISFTVGGETVHVDGAASERTLQELVNAINQSNRKQERSATQAAADLKGIGQSASIAGQSMQRTAVSAQKSDSAISSLAAGIGDTVSTVVSSFQQTSSTVGEFANSLLSTSAQISQEWTRAFVSLSRGGIDPIVLSTSTLKAGLDLAGGTLSKLGGMIPGVPGKVLSGFTTLLTSLGKGAVDILSTQLIESAQAMARYNKMGAIFSEGLGEMRVNTGKTGLTFEQFSRVVEESRDNIKAFGGTLSDGITRLADVSNAMSMSVDSSGKTVRHALLNLGYSVEDQNKLAASYLAQQRAVVGIDRVRAMSSKDVADATLKYATDLKVLQELTGKDAKAIADKAAKDTMRASLMAKLDENQKKALIAANQGIAQLGPEAGQTMQSALTRYLTTGTFDPAVAMSDEMREYIVKIGEGVKSGSNDMQDTTTKANEALKTQLENQAKLGTGLASTTDTILTAGGQLTGAVQTYTSTVNSILANTNITAGATERTRESADKLKNTTDVLTNSTSDMTEASARMTKALNTVSTETLPKVVPAVTSLVTGVSNAAASFEQVARGDSTMKEAALSVKKQLVDGFDGILKGIKQKVDEWMPAKSGKEPSRDTGTLGMTGRLFEANDFYGKIAKGETVLTPGQLENLVSGVSGATMGDAVSQPTNSMQDGLVSLISTMQAAQQKTQSENKKTDTTESLPLVISDALNTIFEGPNGFASVMNSVKTQLSDDSNKQLGAMQEQISKLNDLVSAMQDNVRASENIANVLG